MTPKFLQHAQLAALPPLLPFSFESCNWVFRDRLQGSERHSGKGIFAARLKLFLLRRTLT